MPHFFYFEICLVNWIISFCFQIHTAPAATVSLNVGLVVLSTVATGFVLLILGIIIWIFVSRRSTNDITLPPAARNQEDSRRKSCLENYGKHSLWISLCIEVRMLRDWFGGWVCMSPCCAILPIWIKMKCWHYRAI